MIRSNRTIHRTADGRRIPGTWRHVFIRNGGDYYLTDLTIYADGLVDCWELVTLAEFERKLASGWVATTLEGGARASGHELASWKFAEPYTWLTPELLLAEVRDTIARLNGRPDSTGRCLALVDVFLADRTEANRAAARTAYLAIPESQRHYALGDMDYKDWPLQVLVAGPGGALPDGSEGDAEAAGDAEGASADVVTAEEYEEAVAYFEERDRWAAEYAARTPVDGPEQSYGPALQIYQTFPNGRSENPGKSALRNGYPAPIELDGTAYPTVAHAYWALSVAGTEPAAREAVAAAESAHQARRLATAAPRREGFDGARTAVMTRLLRAKYAQHPELAAVLRGTGDATVLYDDDSDFWGDNGGRGRNWMGRLLELVRAELHAEAVGVG
ncbi:NADAR family protein [Streptomyces sp. NPDC020412]|uniref:NADAR family protein n=1 Tax=Streptomyces sp. NPDC020412 TaxID=3365073 RepID=UPI0037A2E706